MGTRPKEIFHLFGDLNNLSGIGAKTIINLKNLSIEKPRDFLFNLPFSDSEYTNTDIFLNYFCFIL